MHARFLGVFLEVSDDRTLTNLTLKQGYQTVYQSTSMVWTDAPTRLRKLAKQQLRWSRGSQYNTLRMLPWMIAPRAGAGDLLPDRHRPAVPPRRPLSSARWSGSSTARA